MDAAESLGAPSVANGTAHKDVSPHRPIAPGTSGIRCPPRIRCFRGLFLRAGGSGRAVVTGSGARYRLRCRLADTINLSRFFWQAFMARKVVNRRELRAEAEAAEALEAATGE